jgi:hypothetical protein
VAENQTPGRTAWAQRFAALPVWVRWALLIVLVAVVVLISKWLVLVLLLAMGLWPLTLGLGSWLWSPPGAAAGPG